MAKGFNFFNDAYVPNEFEQAEMDFPSEGFEWDNGKPIAGICGYEAALMRELDRQDALASMRKVRA